MLIEFAGRSGTGKSSLCEHVRAHLERDRVTVTRPVDVLVGRWLGRRLLSPRWSNLAQEAVGAHWTLRGRKWYPQCESFVRQRIGEAADSVVERFRLRRSWNRKLGAMAGCCPQSLERSWILLDEGPVHFATILFGRVRAWRSAEVNEYLDVVPLPDWIVCVTAPLPVTERRLAARGVTPMPDRDAMARRRYLRLVDDILRHVALHPRVAPRWLTIENNGPGLPAVDGLADEVIATITARSARKPSHMACDKGPACPTRVPRDSTRLPDDKGTTDTCRNNAEVAGGVKSA